MECAGWENQVVRLSAGRLRFGRVGAWGRQVECWISEELCIEAGLWKLGFEKADSGTTGR